MKEERLYYIDVVKGLSIICIVLLHFEEGLIPLHVNTYIGQYMITAFYVAVGWIDASKCRDITTKDLISKRWVQLGKPYLYWSAIILLFDFILMMFGQCDKYIIARELYKTITLRGIGTLWFLPALLGGEILWNWSKRKDNIKILLLLLVVIVAYHAAFCFYFEGKDDTMSRIINAPFKSLSSMGDAWIGIAFGYYMYNLWNDFLQQSSSFVVLSMGILLSVIAFLTANYYPFAFGDKYVSPLIGPLGLFFIFKVVRLSYITRYLTYWGINSLGLMVIHYSILMVICNLVQNKLDGTTGQGLYGWPSVIYFIITMVVSYFIVEVLKRICPPLLGKNK